MKCGPNPSRPVVEAGASTQFFLKNELPMKNALPIDRKIGRRMRERVHTFVADGGLAARKLFARFVGRSRFKPRRRHQPSARQGDTQHRNST